MDYFDIHAHIFPPHVAEKVIAQLEGYYGFKWEGSGVYEDLIASMDEAGVRRCTIFSCATKPEQVVPVNEYLGSLQAQYPERMVCFGTMHPEFQDPAGEIARLKSMGLRGLKIHPDFQRFKIDDPKMFRIYEAAGEELPLLFHVGDPYQDYSAPRRLGKVLDVMPHLKVIAAHLGGYRAWEEGKRHLVGRKGVFLDTSSSIGYLSADSAREIILAHGCENVLWGSDYPARRHCRAVEDLKSLHLTQEQEEMIFHKNAEKLLFSTDS